MVNYDDLPLFPLHVVLYPEMPLPLHIFEPRYREMILRCREENTPFGVVLISDGPEVGAPAVPHAIGTTARITQFDELPDGRMDIVVQGETRFRVVETRDTLPYLTARVEPFWEQPADQLSLQAPFDSAAALFKTYLQLRFASTGRALSALQLPQEPEFLSYAIASVLDIALSEKQKLLGMTVTSRRLEREVEILGEEIASQKSLAAMQEELGTEEGSVIVPVDRHALGRLSSRN